MTVMELKAKIQEYLEIVGESEHLPVSSEPFDNIINGFIYWEISSLSNTSDLRGYHCSSTSSIEVYVNCRTRKQCDEVSQLIIDLTKNNTIDGVDRFEFDNFESVQFTPDDVFYCDRITINVFAKAV